MEWCRQEISGDYDCMAGVIAAEEGRADPV